MRPSRQAIDVSKKLTLVYHNGALGDFVAVLPTLACARLRWPRDRIVILGKPHHSQLAIVSGFADAAWDVEWSGNNCLFVKGHPQALSRLSDVGSALLFTSADSPLAFNLAEAGCGRLVRQDPFPDSRRSIYDFHLSLFDLPPPVASLLDPFRRYLRERETAATAAGINLTRAVVIHPGSGSPKKNWPLSHFEALGAEIRKHGFEVVWCPGPAEENWKEIEGRTIRDLNPLDLGTLLCRSRLFIGNDSGVSHLAAASGCPAIILFGPSDEVVWAPPGEHVEIVTGTGGFSAQRSPDKIPFEEVLRVVQRKLGVSNRR